MFVCCLCVNPVFTRIDQVFRMVRVDGQRRKDCRQWSWNSVLLVLSNPCVSEDAWERDISLMEPLLGSRW